MEVEQVFEMMHIVEIIEVTIFYIENIYVVFLRITKYNPSTLTRVIDKNP
jgi:hypothetical protein